MKIIKPLYVLKKEFVYYKTISKFHDYSLSNDISEGLFTLYSLVRLVSDGWLDESVFEAKKAKKGLADCNPTLDQYFPKGNVLIMVSTVQCLVAQFFWLTIAVTCLFYYC